MKTYEIGFRANGCIFIHELGPVFSKSGNKRRVATWRCGCGTDFIAAIGNVISGQVASCGCKKRKAIIKRCLIHGQSKIGMTTRLYRFWQSMKDRCHNPKARAYRYYGGSGISCHHKWRGSFQSFAAYFRRHFNLVEIPSGLTMDRKNNQGNYEPGNLRLATRLVQANNKRNNRMVTYNSERMTLSQLARKANMKPGTLWARIVKQGRTIEEAII